MKLATNNQRGQLNMLKGRSGSSDKKINHKNNGEWIAQHKIQMPACWIHGEEDSDNVDLKPKLNSMKINNLRVELESKQKT